MPPTPPVAFDRLPRSLEVESMVIQVRERAGRFFPVHVPLLSSCLASPYGVATYLYGVSRLADSATLPPSLYSRWGI